MRKRSSEKKDREEGAHDKTEESGRGQKKNVIKA